MPPQASLDQALHLGLNLVRGIYALSLVLIFGAFGLGVFFTRVDNRLENVESDVNEIKEFVVKDLGNRVKENEVYRLKEEGANRGKRIQ